MKRAGKESILNIWGYYDKSNKQDAKPKDSTECTLDKTLNVKWEFNKTYEFNVEVINNKIIVFNNKNKEILSYIDNDNPYLNGAIGASIYDNSICKYNYLKIETL